MRKLSARFIGAFMLATTSLSVLSPLSARADAPAQMPPQIAYLKDKLHAKLTFVKNIGGESGYPTYIAELGGKRFTVSLLNSGLLSVGVILDSNGRNLTVEAVAEEEAALSQAMRQVNQVINEAGGIAGALDSKTPDAPHQTPQAAPAPSPAVVAPPAPQAAPAPAPVVDMSAFVSKSNVTPDTLHDDLTKTARLVVGNRNLPHVVMVADPQCPFCHIAWSQLKPLVDAKKIAVEVVLADTAMDSPAHIRPQSADDIAQLLANPQIDKLWMSGVGSTDDGIIPHAATIGTPAFNEADHYRADLNDPFALKYRNAFAGKKSGLPILMYVSKDGNTVYGREGVKAPEDMAAFLSNIL